MRLKAFHAGAVGALEAQADGHVLLLLWSMEQAHVRARHGHLERRGHLLGRDAVQRGLLLVHLEPLLGLVVLDVPVHVHHAVGLREDVLDLPGEGDLLSLIGPVDLGHQRLKHRRAGRHLGHLDARAVGLGDPVNARAHALGDVVALGLAVALGREVDLDVGHVRAAAHEVVAHQTVEVVGRGGPDVHLVVGHLRHGADVVADLARDGGGLLQRRALGHVDDDLELALVVERQHLDHHALEQPRASRRPGGARPSERGTPAASAGCSTSGVITRR